MTLTPWHHLALGDVIHSDRDDADWTVVGKVGVSQFTLENADGRRVTKVVRAGEPGVMLTKRADDALLDGMRTMRDVLGAEAMQTQVGEGATMCPPAYGAPGPLLAHLFVMHGIRFDDVEADRPMSALIEVHMKAHRERGNGYVNHVHTKEWSQIAKS